MNYSIWKSNFLLYILYSCYIKFYFDYIFHIYVICFLRSWDWRSEYDSRTFKVTCNLKVKFTFYTKVQGKVNTYAKMNKGNTARKTTLSCKNIWKIVWLKSWGDCYEMFQKIAVLKFLGKHAWWRPLLPRCAA